VADERGNAVYAPPIIRSPRTRLLGHVLLLLLVAFSCAYSAVIARQLALDHDLVSSAERGDSRAALKYLSKGADLQGSGAR